MGLIVKRVLPLLVLLLLAGSAIFAWNFNQFLNKPLLLDEPVLINYAPGTSASQLADQLVARDILTERHALYLDWYARFTGKATDLKAGEYQLKPGMIPPALIDLLVSGNVYQHRLTLIEGWTFDQIMRAVNGHEALRHTLKGASGAEVMTAIGHSGQHPEGRFAPDTYYFPRGMTDVAFLQRAYTRLQSILQKAWADRDPNLPLDSAYQALILASIIESETGAAKERARISGVFVRRLERGMRLQTDPTVIYGLGESYDGMLHVSDLRKDTPYNTYTNHGLPPTPICMPGAAAIRAAVHPADGDALYFVSKGNGTHYFSETLAEHNQAVDRYLREQE